MKGFKRFGGEFSESGSGGNNALGLWGMFALIMCIGAAILMRRPGLVVVGFMLLFCITVFSTMVAGGETKRIVAKRKKRFLNKAAKAKQQGNHEQSLEYLAKAKVYGRLPKEYEALLAESAQLKTERDASNN